MIPTSVLDLIGNTPLVELQGFDTGPCRLFVKLETQNPGGSIKDRMALAMVEDAERRGALRPGGVMVEATAGNTGIGLALVAAAKGYRLILTIPDKMSQEKIAHCRALGAEVRLCRSDVSKGHPDHYITLAEQIARETGAFAVNQFANPANPRAHEETTGPEIWEQTGRAVDAVVCGVGSGGTLTGLSRYFARVAPQVELVLADPAGSALAGLVTGEARPTGSYAVEGIGGDAIPPVADLARVRHAFAIADAESFETSRALLKRAGLFGGSSSGTLAAAALRYCRQQTRAKRVVTFLCDTGNKYLSKHFNDYWMLDQGYLERPQTGDLRDWFTRRYEEGAILTVDPDDPLLTAFQRMRMADISQVPVVEQGRVVGILDESDLLLAVHGDPARFRQPVRTAMTGRLETLPHTASFDEVTRILDAGKVALIMQDGQFLGLITRTDLLNHLRRKLR